jgi:preprotein translocase subunit SecD
VIYDIFAISFAVIALACIAGAWLRRSKRATFIWAAGSAIICAGSAFAQNFWPVPVFGLMTLWALVSALDAMTNAWRLKVGFALALAVGASVAIYPTVHDEILCSDSREEIPGTCPMKLAELDAETRAEFSVAAAAGNKGFSNWLLNNMGFRMVRGLDLKGGLRLVYTVDVAEAIRDKRDRYYDDLRASLTKAYGFTAGDEPTNEEMEKLAERVVLRKPRDKVNTIELAFNDPADAAQYLNEELLASFRGELTLVRNADDQGKAALHIKSSVESTLRQKAVAQAKEVVNNRIDALGVKEATVTDRDEDIIIEIPGESEKDFQQIRDIISQTARLEFKLLDDENAEAFFRPYLEASMPEGMSIEMENAAVGPNKTVPAYYARIEALPSETLESARERLTEWTRTLPVDEYHEIGFEKIVAFDSESEEYKPIGWRTYYLFSKAELTGDMVRDAIAQADQSDTGMGQWHVSMTLDRRGGRIFEDLTEKNVKKRFAIILDGRVESAPQIREKIGGGQARISMGAGGIEEQFREAKGLELVLRSGALPAPISPSNEQRIGPSLGRDSIDKGLTATAIGGIAVLALMFLFYKRAGFIANMSVFFNLFLQLTALSMFSASMTLPGIAGLALTVGMAVDANVLINERIKEELAAGKLARAAVTTGYEKAFSAIIDGNATTLIAAFILAQYGTGPIKGFAVTLIVGMFCNLFTGVVVTRLFFEFWVRGRRDVSLSM